MLKLKDELRKIILFEHSRKQRDKVVDWVGDSRRRFSVLMELFLGDEYRVVQRAAWAVRTIGEARPQWMTSYIGPMIESIQNPIHDAVVRNGLLVLVGVKIPKRYWGELVEIGFDYLSKVTTPTAIKRAALLVVARIVEQEPELREELVLVLQDQIPYSTVGFKGIATKYIKRWT
ncbi:MAG TPA: hypothetical protein ENK85_09255 [Saprospiraceae bacterium]|nr:hypothetical protein [Saprospiraceae bacterium]